MDAPKTVTATFNTSTPIQSGTLFGIVNNSSNIQSIVSFTDISSSSFNTVNFLDVDTKIPTYIIQKKDKSYFIALSYDKKNNEGGIWYSVNLTNPKWRRLANLPLDTRSGICLEELNDGTFLLIAGDGAPDVTPDTINWDVYQTNHPLDGQSIWEGSDITIPDNTKQIVQGKNNTVYFVSGGNVYSSTDRTYPSGPITLTLSDGKNLNIKSLTQLNDNSFVAVGTDNALYRTTSFPSGWTLVNINTQFVRVAEIIN
jgi:hypothetical protein